MAGNITGTISNEQTASLILTFSGVSSATVAGQGVSLNTGNQSDASTIAGLSSSIPTKYIRF